MYRHFGVTQDYFRWEKARFLFPLRVLRGFVHAGKIPVHLGWMQEQTSVAHTARPRLPDVTSTGEPGFGKLHHRISGRGRTLAVSLVQRGISCSVCIRVGRAQQRYGGGGTVTCR